LLSVGGVEEVENVCVTVFLWINSRGPNVPYLQKESYIQISPDSFSFYVLWFYLLEWITLPPCSREQRTSEKPPEPVVHTSDMYFRRGIGGRPLTPSCVWINHSPTESLVTLENTFKFLSFYPFVSGNNCPANPYHTRPHLWKIII
jgi:hypothetical protein